jgi:hypothetical protein
MTDYLLGFERSYPNLARLTATCTSALRGVPAAKRRTAWLWRTTKCIARGIDHPAGTLLPKLETASSLILQDGSNVEVLSRKFDSLAKTMRAGYRPAHNDRLLDLFTEILGYWWLHEDGYPEVRFVAEHRRKRTPDLEATGRGVVSNAAVECKNVHTSDKEREYFARHQGEARNVSFDLSSSDPSRNPLLRKLLDTARQAAAKFGAYDAKTWRRVVFMNFSPDVDAWLVQQELPADIETMWGTIAETLRQEQVELVVVERYGLGPTREYTTNRTDRQAAVERLVEMDIDLGGKEPREVILEAYREAIERSLRAGDTVHP